MLCVPIYNSMLLSQGTYFVLAVSYLCCPCIQLLKYNAKFSYKKKKLGEGLGTRLRIACVWLCLVCEVHFLEDAVFYFRAMFLASSCSFNVTLFWVFNFFTHVKKCCVGGTSIQVYCAWCPIVKVCCVRGTGIEVCFAGLWTVIYGPASWAGEGLSCL